MYMMDDSSRMHSNLDDEKFGDPTWIIKDSLIEVFQDVPSELFSKNSRRYADFIASNCEAMDL